RAVPALVDTLVDVAVFLYLLDHGLDPLDVARVGGANEEVIGRVDPGNHVAEAGGAAVDQFLRRDALFLGGLGDRFAVFVGAGQEEDVLAALAVMPGEDVGR